MAYEVIDVQEWMRAAEDGDAGAVVSLLAAGAEVDARTRGGETALMRAAARGHAGLVRVLLELGADPNLRRLDGWTALMLAAFFGHAEAARELVRGGADMGAADRQGMTAFKWAASRGHAEVVRLLGDGGSSAATVQSERTAERVEGEEKESRKAVAEITAEAFAPVASGVDIDASAESVFDAPEVRSEVGDARDVGTRGRRSADERARFWRTAALGLALLSVGGAALAYKFAGAGARVAATPEAQTQPTALPVEMQPAVPITPTHEPLPSDATAQDTGTVLAEPAVQPSVPTYFPPSTTDAGVVPPAEIIPPRESYPVNQPPARPAGGEPAVVNLGQPEKAADAAEARRAPESDAANTARAVETPVPPPARDDSAQKPARPARTAETPAASPTPKGKVVNWP